MVTTRKRGTPVADVSAAVIKRKRRDQTNAVESHRSHATRPTSPLKSPTKPSPLPKGRRGLALLSAAGVPAPPAAELESATSLNRSSPQTSKRDETPRRSPKHEIKQKTRSGPEFRALLQQPLPSSYAVLEDFFSALQLNYGMLRKRGQKCTYQSLRTAVEEHTGRRFQVSHLAQLQFLLPDVMTLEYIRLPVAPHSSRTEPHLAIALGPMPPQWELPTAHPPTPEQHEPSPESASIAAGGAEAGVGEGDALPARKVPAPPPSAALSSPMPDGDVKLLRQLLRYRLARFLLAAYRRHLEEVAGKLHEEGDAAGAAHVRDQMRCVPTHTFRRTVSGSRCSPPGRDTPPADQRQPTVQGSTAEAEGAGAASPTRCKPVLQFAAGFLETAPSVPQQMLPPRPERAAAVAAAAASPAALTSHLRPPATPSSTVTAGGRPPLPPPTGARGQRRLSFGGPAAVAPPIPPPSGATPRLPFKSTRPGATPLDKLEKQLPESGARRGLFPTPGSTSSPQLGPEDADEQFTGRILSEEEFRATLDQERARVFDSLPQAAKRLSMEGVMSFEAHMAVEAASQHHRMSCSQEAVEARALRNALGMLPKTFTRVQRIFGAQGPNALKLKQVLGRLRATDETFSEAELERQVQLLAHHAPECCSLRPFGRCGTPAVWWDRRAERGQGAAVHRRLKALAEGRHIAVQGPDAGIAAPATAIELCGTWEAVQGGRAVEVQGAVPADSVGRERAQ